MSITTEITRLQGAKNTLKTKLNAKNDAQHQITTETIDEYGDFVDSIPTGVTPTGTVNITENGTVDVTNYASANVNVSGGGGEVVSKGVDFVDYNGDLVASYTIAEAQNLTTLPNAPTHSELVFDGWNYTLAEVNSLTTYATIGALYHTVSGAVEVDIKLNKAIGLAVSFTNLNGMTSIDWGDGTTNSTTSHTYSDYGEYTIKLYGITSITGPICGQQATNRNYSIQSIRCSSTITSFINDVLSCCVNMKSISFSTSITRLDEGNQYLNQLKCLIYPHTLTYNSKIIGMRNQQMTSLKYLSIPIGFTLQNYPGQLASLTNINWRTNGTTLTLNTNAYSQYHIHRITIASTTITSIPSTCYFTIVNIDEIDFTMFNAVPTLASTNTFGNYFNKKTKIIVPDSLYNNWIAATNWSTYANYIYKKSEVETA